MGGPTPFPQSPYPYRAYGQPPAHRRTTNGFATASLVLGIIGPVGVFVCLILSIVFGFIALGQTKDGRQKGRGLAIAGLALSAIWIVFLVLLGVALLVVEDNEVAASKVDIGDCIEDAPESGSRFETVEKVTCDDPHEAEVFEVFGVNGDDYPGDESIVGRYSPKCVSAFNDYVTRGEDYSDYDIIVLVPDENSWSEGDHEATCLATTSDSRTGSIKDR